MENQKTKTAVYSKQTVEAKNTFKKKYKAKKYEKETDAMLFGGGGKKKNKKKKKKKKKKKVLVAYYAAERGREDGGRGRGRVRGRGRGRGDKTRGGGYEPLGTDISHFERRDRYSDSGTHRAPIINALRKKANIAMKLKNETIVAKWRTEALEQGAGADDFDSAIRILSKLMRSGRNPFDREFEDEIWEDLDQRLYINLKYISSWEHRAFIIKALRGKANLRMKLRNEAVVANWKAKILKEGASEDDFDDTIRILWEMLKSRRLREKRAKNQYYSDDEDSVTSDEHFEHRNVVQQTEKEMELTDLGARLRKYVSEELEGKLSESEKDFHPGSNGQVLDLVHPSLYCYVDGQTELIDSKVTDEIRAFFKHRNENSTKARSGHTVSAVSTDEVDPEVRFQWMPAEFRMNEDGSVSIDSYINNLDRTRHGALYGLIGDIFAKIAPLFKQVMRGWSEVNFSDDDLPKTTTDKSELEMKDRLQVIVKMANIEISGDEEYGGGVWHVEGMKYEHIAASAIYYYDVQNIKGSFLQFRERGPREVYVSQGDHAAAWETYKKEKEEPSCIYRGKVPIDEPKIVCFTNNMQHRVTKHKLRDPQREGRRKILVFFLVDPKHRIVSSEMVPFQQKHIMAAFLKEVIENLALQGGAYFENLESLIADYLPCVELQQAKQNREELMFVRKYKQDEDKRYIERPFSFCEH